MLSSILGLERGLGALRNIQRKKNVNFLRPEPSWNIWKFYFLCDNRSHYDWRGKVELYKSTTSNHLWYRIKEFGRKSMLSSRYDPKEILIFRLKFCLRTLSTIVNRDRMAPWIKLTLTNLTAFIRKVNSQPLRIIVTT